MIRWLRGEPARDDRGIVVEALDVRRIRTSAEEGAGTTKALATQLAKMVKQRSRGWDPRIFLVSLVASLPFFGVMLLLRFRGLAYTGSLFAFVFIHSRLVRRYAEHRMARETASTIAAHGLCGSCGYSLRDLPPEPDGCAICPECGSAWAPERMTRAHWASPKTPLFAPRSFSTAVLLTLPGIGADARGVVHRRLDTRLTGLTERVRGSRDKTEWAALRRALRRSGRGWRIAISVPVFALIVICIRGIWLEARSPTPDVALVIFLIIVIPFLVYVTTAVLLGEIGAEGRAIRRAFALHRTCCVCGERLDPRATRWGELLCCDGCGCAWSAPGSDGVEPEPRAQARDE